MQNFFRASRERKNFDFTDSVFFGLSATFIFLSLHIQNRENWAESATVYLTRTKNSFPLIGTGGYFELPQIFAFIFNHLHLGAAAQFLTLLRVIDLLVVVLISYYIYMKMGLGIGKQYYFIISTYVYLLFLHPSISAVINVFMILYLPHLIWLIGSLLSTDSPKEPSSILLVLAVLCKPNLLGFAILALLIINKKMKFSHWLAFGILVAQFYILMSKGPYTNFGIPKNFSGIVELSLSTFEVLGSSVIALPSVFTDNPPSLHFALFALFVGFLITVLLVVFVVYLHRKSEKSFPFLKLSVLAFGLLAISFNEFQWNMTASLSNPSLNQVFELLKNDAFTTTWKYKLQYHIIDYTFLVSTIVILVSKFRNQDRKRTIIISFFFTILLFITPSYISKASDPTVAVKWNPESYLSANKEQICYPINPLPDWDFQVSPILSSGWLFGGCSTQWVDYSKKDQRIMGSNSRAVLDLLISKEPEDYRNLILYVDRQPQSSNETKCVSTELHPGYVSSSYWTLSGYHYILFGFSKKDTSLIANGIPILVSCATNQTSPKSNWKYEFIFPGY